MEKNTFSKFCLKIFTRLIGLDICCFIVSAFGIASSGSQLVRTLLQIACIIGLIAFIYPVCHRIGDIDAPLIATGHRKYSPLKGLYAGLIASSPLLISGIALLIAKFLNLFPVLVNYYKIINSFFFPFLYSIMPVDYTLAELSYSSILLGLSVQIIIPVVCMLAYMLGFNRFSFSEKVFYKRKTIDNQ